MLRPVLIAFMASTVGAAPLEDPPLVSVEAQGEATVVSASVVIAAPPQAVWNVIYDCAGAGRLMRKLKSCKVLEADPQGRWDVREHVIQPLVLPPVRMVVRSQYDPPRGVVFAQVSGDVRGQAGRWRLEALDGGTATRARYDNRIVLGLPIAGLAFRQALRAEAPRSLINLRRAAEAAQE